MDIFEIAEISALQSKAGFKAVPRLNTRKLIQEIGTYSIPSEMKALVYEYGRADALNLINLINGNFANATLWKTIFEKKLDLSLLNADDLTYTHLDENNIEFFIYCKKNRLKNIFSACCLTPQTALELPIEDLKAVDRGLGAVRMEDPKNIKDLVQYGTLLDFFYQKHLYLSDRMVLKIENPDKVLKLLIKINMKLKNDQQFKDYLFSFRVVEFNCRILGKYLKKGCPEFEEPNDFLNICTDNRYNNLFDRKYNERYIILQALLSGKYHFLDTISKMDILFSESSVFRSEALNCLNLNELSEKDIEVLATEKCYMQNTGCKYTAREFIMINRAKKYYNSSEQFFYDNMTGSIDEKVLKFRQLVNAGYNFEGDFSQFLKRINEKRFSDWKNEAPEGTDVNTIIRRLNLPKEYDDFISECTTAEEYKFASTKNVDLKLSLKENIDAYVHEDSTCIKLFNLLDLPLEYKDSFEKFCISGNADITMTYYNQVNSSERRESVLKAAKAEIMGKMEEFKFYNLQKEIETTNSDIFDMWKLNSTMKDREFEVCETYGFADTMLIGEQPTHTCMSYRDGMYKDCLLANFDANKKIIYVRRNQRIVARAIIRLTKYSEQEYAKLEFLDVASECRYEHDEEKLVIFIERLYTSHLNNGEIDKCKRLIVKMLKKKTADLAIEVFACEEYNSLYPDLLKNMGKKNVFISHTKNDIQYMDSFGGERGKSAEAKYIPCKCLY